MYAIAGARLRVGTAVGGRADDHEVTGPPLLIGSNATATFRRDAAGYRIGSASVHTRMTRF